MLWKIFLPERSREICDCWDFFTFLNQMAARWFQGHWRWGAPDRRKKYQDWLALELRAYERTGNKEHLLNVAVLAYLEFLKPQHPDAHLDATVESERRSEALAVE